MLIKEFVSGEKVEGKFAVKYKKPPKEYRNGFWFEFRISDRTGELTAKYWGERDLSAVERAYNSFQKNDVVYLTGVSGVFNNVPEVSINQGMHKLRKCAPSEYNIEDFVPKSKRDIGEMEKSLLGTIQSIENPVLRSVLDSFFEDKIFLSKFRSAPASMHIHSNHIGGLLEHTLNVVAVCEALAKLHSQLDRDLMVTGAILHDVGKVREFEVTTSIDVSEEGMLIGHVNLGVEMLLERTKAISNFTDSTKLKLAHIILSHHGELENGAPKKPQFAEAIAIHYADDCDAKIQQFIRLKEEALTEDLWIWDKRVGHVYLK